MKVRILSCISVEDLEALINQLLQQGWQLHGNLTLDQRPSGHRFIQVMINNNISQENDIYTNACDRNL